MFSLWFFFTLLSLFFFISSSSYFPPSIFLFPFLSCLTLSLWQFSLFFFYFIQASFLTCFLHFLSVTLFFLALSIYFPSAFSFSLSLVSFFSLSFYFYPSYFVFSLPHSVYSFFSSFLLYLFYTSPHLNIFPLFHLLSCNTETVANSHLIYAMPLQDIGNHDSTSFVFFLSLLNPFLPSIYSTSLSRLCGVFLWPTCFQSLLWVILIKSKNDLALCHTRFSSETQIKAIQWNSFSSSSLILLLLPLSHIICCI